MSNVIDRDASGANHVAGLYNENLMKSSPVFAALRAQFAALNAAFVELQTQHNALCAVTLNVSLEVSKPAPKF